MSQQNVPDSNSLFLRPNKNVRGAGMDVLQEEDILRVEDYSGNAAFRVAADGGLSIARALSPGAGINQALMVEPSYAMVPGEIQFGVYAYLHQTGSATPVAGDHAYAVLGRSTDTASGKVNVGGVEGRVDAKGTALQYNAVTGVANFQGTTFNGQSLTGYSTTMAITTDGTTPLVSGVGVGYFASAIVGGAGKYSFWGKDPCRIDNSITANDTSGTNGAVMSHNGTDGTFSTTAGHMYFSPASGVVIDNVTFRIPLANGSGLGSSANRWALSATTGDFSGAVTIPGSGTNVMTITTATANGSVATTLGSVGPTGATAGNPQGWEKIIVNGTARYRPFW
jgi:hypothetical protein